jgi:nitrate reductase NapD
MTMLHVASFIVRARPEIAAVVAAGIAQMPDAQVYAVEAGKIVVVVEASSERALADYMDELRQQPDVLMVSLVYHEMDGEAHGAIGEPPGSHLESR